MCIDYRLCHKMAWFLLVGNDFFESGFLKKTHIAQYIIEQAFWSLYWSSLRHRKSLLLGSYEVNCQNKMPQQMALVSVLDGCSCSSTKLVIDCAAASSTCVRHIY